MKIAIIGTGYVGLPSGVGFADLDHDVICIDREIRKIDLLKNGNTTLFEDGLEDLLRKNLANGKIKFTTLMKEGISGADIVIIAVGTPPHPVTHEADMQYVYGAATELAPYLNGYTVIAIKSTVPVGTGDIVEQLIKKTNKMADIDVVSMPEFLREGYALKDFFNPDRIIIGVTNNRPKSVISKLYSHLNNKINFVGRRSSEIIKYASNSFLAIKIHYINEIANLCEHTSANVLEVARGMGLDSRIGPKFLNPGPGFGGSCFPKDTVAMSYIARQNGVNLSLIDAAILGNQRHMDEIAQKVINYCEDNLDIKKVSCLGLAFKNGTDDCRESPAIRILNLISEKIRKNIVIDAFDPKAMSNAKKLINSRINLCSCVEDCINSSDCLIVLTEWSQFKLLNLDYIYNSMNNKKIFDFRNLFNKSDAVAHGFDYYGVGV